MNTQTLLEAGRAPATQARLRGKPAVGSMPDPRAALVLGLQRTAGNAAIARYLRSQRSSAVRRSHPGALELQRCGPPLCNCSDEERGEYAPKHLEEDPHKQDAENPETVHAPLQRSAGDGDPSGFLPPPVHALLSSGNTTATSNARVATQSIPGGSLAGATSQEAVRASTLPTGDVVAQRVIPSRVKPGDNATSRAARAALDRARREAILAYKARKVTWRQFIEIHTRIRSAETALESYREAIGTTGGGWLGPMSATTTTGNPLAVIAALGATVLASAALAPRPTPGIEDVNAAEELGRRLRELGRPIDPVVPPTPDRAPRIEEQPAPRRKDNCGDPRTICVAPGTILGSDVAAVWGNVAEDLIQKDFCSVLGGGCVEGVDVYFDESERADLLTLGLVRHNPHIKRREAELRKRVRSQSRPDIVSFASPREYYEIKPFSLTGVPAGGAKLTQIADLMADFRLPYRPGTAYNPKHTIPLARSLTVSGCPFQVDLKPTLVTPGLLVYQVCITGPWGVFGPGSVIVNVARIHKTIAETLKKGGR